MTTIIAVKNKKHELFPVLCLSKLNNRNVIHNLTLNIFNVCGFKMSVAKQTTPLTEFNLSSFSSGSCILVI